MKGVAVLIYLRSLGVSSAVLAALLLMGCGGSKGTSIPSAGVQANDHSNHVLTSRGRAYLATLNASRDIPIAQKIDMEAARGARVFRIPTVSVFDFATNQAFNVPKTKLRHTAQGTVVIVGTRTVQLSSAAKILMTPQYGYLFVHGSQPDPDPSSGAERIR